MQFRSFLATFGLVVANGVAFASAVPLVNLAQTSNAQALFAPALGSGTTGGIIDRSLWGFNGNQTSPRVNDTFIQPYITWSSNQNVRVIRVLNDTFANDYDRLVVDTLNPGGNPTNNADWTQRYDSGGGLANPGPFDINLGTTYSTAGVRVNATRVGGPGDFAFGELEVYSPLPVGSTLASDRINVPTANFTASSTAPGTQPGFAGQWADRWLSDTQAINGGTEFTLDRHLTSPSNLTNISIGWLDKSDNGTRALPTSWDVMVKTTANANWTTVGTYTPSLNNLSNLATWYYNDLGGQYDVTDVRIRVPFTSLSGSGDKIGIAYSEIFSIPEPASAGLIGLVGIILTARRRTR